MPQKEEKIKIHFFKEIISFSINLLKINPKGMVNWAPIIIGERREEKSIARYKKAYTQTPITKENNKRCLKFFLGIENLKKGRININKNKTLSEPISRGGK